MFGTVQDITERKRAEEGLRDAQMELAHVNRVATMGQLSASIAHEVNQPVAAVLINADVALHWLSGPTPDLDQTRQALGRIVKNGQRAGEIIGRTLELSPCSHCIIERLVLGLRVSGSGSSAAQTTITTTMRVAQDCPGLKLTRTVWSSGNRTL